MNFKINKNKIEKAIERVSVAINPINIVSFLRYMKLDFRPEGLYLIGSDGEISISHFIEKNEFEFYEGITDFLLSHSLFKNVLKKINGLIEITLEGNLLSIKNNEDVYNINTIESDDFPLINFSFDTKSIKIDSTSFRRIVKDTSFAALTEGTEIILECMNLQAEKGHLKFAATDRYRIATETIPISNDIEFNISIVAKNLKNFIPIDYNGQIEIFIDDNKIETQVENTKIQCKVIDYPYKDISSAFPKLEDLVYKIEIEKKELSDLISKATILSNDSFFKLNIKVNKNKIKLYSSKEETGNISVSSNNVKYDSAIEELGFSINHKYLKEAISVFDGTLIIFLDKEVRKVYIVSTSNRNNKQLIGTT
ncbi:DNA polymerase III subunit beta [Mesomycoplasma molare]|uniref:DNA polymerase III subunit beta n=1 Tax=Mesomycoplasma molare TaxID=171288 RepID=A0ABY5TVE3_9BACT|nr:DNA polymerase III subunit beta [Mesomycoplasma molare]UWD34210.1 DNA polymerase III subunit beta [Mesomycoplasma molare]